MIVKWHSDPWPVTVTSHQIRLSTNFHDLDTGLTFTELRVVSLEHLQRVWLARRERLPFWTPGSVPLLGTCLCSNCWDQCRIFSGLLPWIPLGTFLILHTDAEFGKDSYQIRGKCLLTPNSDTRGSTFILYKNLIVEKLSHIWDRLKCLYWICFLSQNPVKGSYLRHRKCLLTLISEICSGTFLLYKTFILAKPIGATSESAWIVIMYMFQDAE